MSRSLESITNFVQLTDRIGTAGQPAADQFDAIADAGFVAVINLALPDHPDSLENEGSLVTSRGMHYHQMPVVWEVPRQSDLHDFAAVMGAYAGRKVFVHCIMNYRVSAFCYRYLTQVEGLSDDAARSPIFDEWTPEGIWADVMKWDVRA